MSIQSNGHPLPIAIYDNSAKIGYFPEQLVRLASMYI